ncbi:MAG: hypothetical protein ACRDOF_07420 [Gaiellaceae bacterium]
MRPTLKERYPLIPIGRYAEWRRDDGSHFDPWIRIHESSAVRSSLPRARGADIAGAVAEWEKWTGMRFPEDGAYVFPNGLATLVVEEGIGTHVEPNVWVLHRV